MAKQSVLIAGSSGHAKVVVDIFEKTGEFDILGFLDPMREIGEETMGYKVVGKEEDLPTLLTKHPELKIFVALGDNSLRYRTEIKIRSIVPDIEFPNAIHPSAKIGGGVKLGRGIAIMAGAIVNTDSEIGDFVVINTRACLDHDGKMADFSSLAPGVTAGGCVTIGTGTAISIGATIKHGITIGMHSVVGAGSVVLKNVGDHVVTYGVPAKTIRSRENNSKYL